MATNTITQQMKSAPKWLYSAAAMSGIAASAYAANMLHKTFLDMSNIQYILRGAELSVPVAVGIFSLGMAIRTLRRSE